MDRVVARYGFRTRAFRSLTVEQSAAEMARLGFDCVEVCLEAPDVRPESLDKRRCAQLAQSLQALGIELASVSYHGDRDPLPERRANQERAIRVAHWFGADILVVNTEKVTEPERQWAEHVEHLRHLCAVAEAANVTLALEPEPLLVVGSSHDMVEMMRAVGSPRLKVNLDVGHAYLTDTELAASVRELSSAIVHLHLDDMKGRTHRHLFFGEGDIDYAALRQALYEVAYAGPYVADLGAPEDPRETARRALEALRRLFG